MPPAWNLCSILHRDFNVVVDRRGGLGPAGTVASRLLIEPGMDSEIAMASVRANDLGNRNDRGENVRLGLGQGVKKNVGGVRWTGSKRSRDLLKSATRRLSSNLRWMVIGYSRLLTGKVMGSAKLEQNPGSEFGNRVISAAGPTGG